MEERFSNWTVNKIAQSLVFIYVISIYAIWNDQLAAFYQNIALLVLFLVLLVQIVRNHLLIPPSIFLLISFLLFCFFSVLWSINTGSALTLVFRTAASGLIGVTVWLELKMGMPYRVLLIAAMIGAGVQVVYQLITNPVSLSQMQYASISGNANTFAVLLIGSAYFSFCNPSSPHKKLYSLISIGLLVFALLFTGSRKVFIAFACLPLFLVSWALRKRHLVISFSVVILVLIAIITLYTYVNEILDTPFLQGIYSVQRLRKTISGYEDPRLGMIDEGIEIWSQHPIVGIGMNQYAQVSSFNVYSHNNYIELLANTGIIGFILYYSFFIAIFLNNLSKLRTDLRKQYSTILLVLILLLDIGMVSYSDKLNWIMLGVSAFLAGM